MIYRYTHRPVNENAILRLRAITSKLLVRLFQFVRRMTWRGVGWDDFDPPEMKESNF
jgi:hypothetical protein